MDSAMSTLWALTWSGLEDSTMRESRMLTMDRLATLVRDPLDAKLCLVWIGGDHEGEAGHQM